MKKVHFARDVEIIGDQGQRKGMWARTKNESDPTAVQSLQAIAHRADAPKPTDHTDTLKWSCPVFSKLPSTKHLRSLVPTPSIKPLKNWLWSFSEFLQPQSTRICPLTFLTAPAGRAAQTERNWQNAVERANATLVFHERMVRPPVFITDQF